MKTLLTVEESQRLIELGVDPKMASMKEFIPIHPEVLKGNVEYAKPWGWMPKFRLEDILSILPKEIDGYELNMSANKCEYFVSYILWDTMDEGDYIKDILSFKQFSAPELIDALNQLLIWCLEQKNHQKKGGLIWYL